MNAVDTTGAPGTVARPGVAVLGTTFQNPVLLAAGTAGFGREVAEVIDLEALGGIITKAVTITLKANKSWASGLVPARTI